MAAPRVLAIGAMMIRTATPLLTALALFALSWGAPAAAADTVETGGLLRGVSPLSARDLAGFAAGSPLILEAVQTSGGGIAGSSVEPSGDGRISIRSSAQSSASVAGAPVTLSGGVLSTGSIGAVAMENSAGISGLQIATGLGNVQQSAVSFVFVLSGLPQP